MNKGTNFAGGTVVYNENGTAIAKDKQGKPQVFITIFKTRFRVTKVEPV